MFELKGFQSNCAVSVHVEWDFDIPNSLLVQSAVAVEYTDSISGEG